MWQVIQSAAVAILGAVAAVGIAVIATALVWGAVGRIVPHDFHDVPMLQRLAVVAGIVMAVGIVLGGPTARSFAESRLFDVGGPWDLPLDQFLLQRILAPLGVAREIGLHIAEANWRTVYPVATGLVLAIGTALMVFRYWRGTRALRAAFGALALAFGIAIIGFYVAEGALWLMHKLNFWTFAVLTLLYQRRRQAEH